MQADNIIKARSREPDDLNKSSGAYIEASSDTIIKADIINPNIIALDEFKKFLNLEGIDYDDDILKLTLETAEAYCLKHNEAQYTKENCPKEVKYAILGLAAHYFESRTGEESQSEKAALKGVHRLLNIAREKFTL